ncbi:MAG TPA: protein kinase, partial [Aggregatilineales bacterium]|nr:protein kinase [Aggregatilineales bacterium]
MAEELAGKTLSKYELRERIGRGGMAEVYRAYHAALDRFVAIKILHPFLGEDPEFKERFEREARSVAQLRHPNIVQVYDFDFDPERELYYMVMEYVEGPTLRTRLMELG